MALTNYTLTASASATNRYTAAADVDALICNPSLSETLRFDVTQSDSLPSVAVAVAAAIHTACTAYLTGA